jgi:hypothetical protein
LTHYSHKCLPCTSTLLSLLLHDGGTTLAIEEAVIVAPETPDIEERDGRTRGRGLKRRESRLGAGYTSNLVRAICCKSQVQFAVSAIWCPTRINFYLFLHRIADAIWCAIQCPFCSCAEIVHALNHDAISHAMCKR